MIPFTKLHLGCGKTIMERPWCNLDMIPMEGVDCVFDLSKLGTPPELAGTRSPTHLPFPPNTFDELLMSHVLEHLPNPLAVLEELHVVAQPDAVLTVRVPYGATDAAFEDPQHCRQYFLQSFEYFGQPCYWRADYGYRGDWQTIARTLIINQDAPFVGGAQADLQAMMDLVMHARNIVLEFYVELRAVKPIREMKRELGSSSPIAFSFISAGGGNKPAAV